MLFLTPHPLDIFQYAYVKTYKYLTDCIDIFTHLNDEIEIIQKAKGERLKYERWDNIIQWK